MQEDLHRDLSLNKMAECVNLSPTRFCYLFKSVTGTPPAKFLKSLRMREAANLLASSFLSVKEILTRAGFTDGSHFVKDFKKMYGMTPSEYRKRVLLSAVAASDSAQMERSANLL